MSIPVSQKGEPLPASLFTEINFINKFIANISSIYNILEFLYIGDLTLFNQEENSENSFEVYCRYNIFLDELDFILNETTRSK